MFLIGQKVLKAWTREPEIFKFPVAQGCVTYEPDFLLEFADGREEYHEVKGFMDKKSATRLARMKEFYPEKVVRVIDKEWFKDADEKYGHLPGWEK